MNKNYYILCNILLNSSEKIYLIVTNILNASQFLSYQRKISLPIFVVNIKWLQHENYVCVGDYF